tara:strand:+ start:7518 stop:9500 length:1983 start_codon:yes stop_codon:yes gene_type:complete
MAKSTNVIDMDAMYRAGYGQARDVTGDRTQKNALINKALVAVGGWVINKYQASFAELKATRRVGRKTANGVQIEMDKLGDQLSPDLQKALTEFKLEYDKGARKAKMALGRTGREEGELMMDLAWQKMTNLNKKLSYLEEMMQVQRDSGAVELGDIDPRSAEGGRAITAWNPGADVDDYERAVRLASGSMLENLTVDRKTGDIMYLQENEADTSDEAWNAYTKELTDAGKFHSTRGDWEARQKGEIEKILFEDVEFPGVEDNSLQGFVDPMMTAAEQIGLDGRELDDLTKRKSGIQLSNAFGDASENAVRSFFFGGNIIDADSNDLEIMTPAFKYLIDKGHNPGNAMANPGTQEYEDYQKFQGLLHDLKGQDFSKGSPYRDDLVEMVNKSINAYHANGYDVQSSKQETDDQRQLDLFEKQQKLKVFAPNRTTPGAPTYILRDGRTKIDAEAGDAFINDIKNTEPSVMTPNAPNAVWNWDDTIKKYKTETFDKNGNSTGFAEATKYEMILNSGIMDKDTGGYSEQLKKEQREAAAFKLNKAEQARIEAEEKNTLAEQRNENRANPSLALDVAGDVVEGGLTAAPFMMDDEAAIYEIQKALPKGWTAKTISGAKKFFGRDRVEIFDNKGVSQHVYEVGYGEDDKGKALEQSRDFNSNLANYRK